jgi:acetoacetyl-CoA synthetase
MPVPLWTPSSSRIERAAMTAFRRAAERTLGQSIPDYRALHDWSVRRPAAFWDFLANWSGIEFDAPAEQVMSEDPMPATKWFTGARLNYARALLHPPGVPADAIAVVAVDEDGRERTLTWAQLRARVAQAAAALARDGIETGDRVAAYAANVPEMVILLLACAARGVIFSSCSPDFGFDAAYARFHQIAPKLLVASDAYRYNGKPYDTTAVVSALAESIEPHPKVVLLPLDADAPGRGVTWEQWLTGEAQELRFASLPFEHPLYILYSSGTTGLPKAIVHRAGGVLLTHSKEHRLHSDIGPGDRVFYFTTCGWMMWNWLVSALAQRATVILYEGSPSYPSLHALWRLAERLRISHFGTSARFIHSCKAAALRPQASLQLDPLKAVLSTGSPLSPAGFEWVYDAVANDVHLASISGGTDIVGCFMLGVPTEPVYTGQIQAPGLGVGLAVFDEHGVPVVGQPGELVCRTPLPSMPLRFWNDPEGIRYREAYFDVYPGVWRHGDLIEITPERGIIVYGRSDATLNPGGVRIGTAEIYRPLESIPEIADALALGKKQGEDEVIWLLVVLDKGLVLDDSLSQRIKSVIRAQESPRHVPQRILQVSQLPRTRSGKTMEIAVSRLLNGQHVTNREVAANPEAFDEIARVAELPSPSP